MHFFVYNTLVRFVRGIVMRADALTMTLLYDYYGELLTEKQRQLFDLYYNQDYSLSEIAQTAGISRQGVHDTLARAEQLLEGYEQALGCIARDRRLEAALGTITRSAQALTAIDGARPAAETILRAVQELKE